MGVLTAEIIAHIKTLKVPGDGVIAIVCGIINIFLSGIGTIIAGALDGNTADIIIGLIQLVLILIILGWVWSIVWGILMIIKGL